MRGLVVNVQTGLPESSVDVTAQEKPRGKEFTGKTTVNGEFRLDDLPPGKWTLSAHGEGYASIHANSHWKEIELGPGQQLENIDLQVSRSATLEITVMSFIGKPIPGAKVQVYSGRSKKGEGISSSPWHEEGHGTSGLLSTAYLAEAYSNDTGGCRFEGLEPGFYDLVAFATGFARLPLHKVPTGTNDATFRLEPEVRVLGTVTLDRTKARLPGASVEVTCQTEGLPLFSGSILTDASGGYEITCLPRKSRLTVQAVSGEIESSVFNLAFRGDTETHARDLTVFDNRIIKGRLIDSFDRKPLSEIEVWLENRLGTRQVTTSNGEGWFSIETGISTHRIQFRKVGQFKTSEWIPVEFKREQKTVLLPLIELEAGIPVTGKVTDGRTKMTLANAQVRALPADKSVLDPNRYPHTTTDAKGAYSLEAVPPGRYHLTAEKTGYRPGYYGDPKSATGSQHPILHVLPGPALTDINISLVPIPTVQLAGIVQDQKGDAIQGVALSLLSSQDLANNPPFLADTDENGKFLIENVPIGRYSLVAEHPDYWPGGSDSIDAFPKKSIGNITIVLETREGQSISGRVYDPDGNPLREAQVWCLIGRMENLYASGLLTANGYVSIGSLEGDLNDDQQGTRQLVRSTNDGTYRIDNLRPGKYTVGVVTPKGFSGVKYDVDAGAEGVDFQIAGGGGIRGIVYLSDGQTPCSNFTARVKPVSFDPVALNLSNIGDSAPFSEDGQIFQSPDGSFDIPDLPDGIYTLSIVSEEQGEATLFGVEVIDSQYAPDLAIVLDGGGIIFGTVVSEDGKPIEGASARLGEVVKETSSDGSFEFRGLAADRYAIQITHPDYAMKAVPNLNLSEGSDLNLGKVSLTQGGRIDGRVVYANGEGANGYVIRVDTSEGMPLSGIAGSRGYSARTDNEGYFTVAGLSGGKYRLTLCRTGSSGDQVLPKNGRPVQSHEFLLKDGAVFKPKLVVDEGVQVFGTVRMKKQPLARSTVVLYPKFKTSVREFTGLTDQWGNYSFPGVPAGQYDAVVAEFSPEDARTVQLTVPDKPMFHYDFNF